MGYMKYLLYKTGHFPKYEPAVSDVLEAAIKTYRLEKVIVSNGRHYFYVFPMHRDWTHLSELMRIFRSNGVFLLPHKSRHYAEWVLRVPNHNQEFMKNVMNVSNNKDEFQKLLLQKYGKEKQG